MRAVTRPLKMQVDQDREIDDPCNSAMNGLDGYSPQGSPTTITRLRDREYRIGEP